jgi:hypothetical protein
MKQENLSLVDQAILVCQETLETIKRQKESIKLSKDYIPVCQECGEILNLPDEKKYNLCRGCSLYFKWENDYFEERK